MPKKSKCGRKKKLTPEQTKVVAEKYAEGEYTIESIALAMRVSPETIRRAVNQLNE
ncbi:helix-turn-helix domain-containing protein [Aeromonas hydrophila]|nr:helix-turn-helix domain-containing protein [Aeromonas hydrophila]MDD9223482.1 helix-turn-helix domain-containing protein [Aeromonas hydrophila]